jgi:hypothetical protein
MCDACPAGILQFLEMDEGNAAAIARKVHQVLGKAKTLLEDVKCVMLLSLSSQNIAAPAPPPAPPPPVARSSFCKIVCGR